MAFVGIVGARKYRDKQSVKYLVEYLPADSAIVTSSCMSVCSWTIEATKERGIEVMVYSPDLSNIRSRFEVADRYYQRNRELIERCDLVHAFISEEDGCTGGTGFEVDREPAGALSVLFAIPGMQVGQHPDLDHLRQR